MARLRKKMSYFISTAIAGVLCTGPAYSSHETGLSSGMPRVLNEGDFVCSFGQYFDIVWDGWEGRLELYPGGTGRLLGSGFSFAVRHTVARNPQDDIEGLKGPGFTDADPPSSLNHRLVFWVDFEQTPFDPNDDQRFDGYMRTANPGHPYFQNTIAGITWWQGLPFAFYDSTTHAVWDGKYVSTDTCIPPASPL